MEKNSPQKQEPKASQNNQKDKKHPHKEKGEQKEKRVRPQRKNQYEYNADIIDQNTQIPPLPKKNQILPKPDIKVFKEKEKGNSNRIDDIIKKKKDIRAEKFVFKKKVAEGDNKHSQLQSEFGEVQQLRDKLSELKVQRNKLGDELHEAIQKAKVNNQKLKEYRSALKGSRQNFSERLRELEHIQTTKDMSKNQEKEVNNQIMILKRRIKEAESTGNIEIKLEQAEDLKDQLDDLISTIKKEKDPIDKEVNALKEELDEKKKQIQGIRDVMSAQKTQKNQEKERHNKEYELWKQNKKKRLDNLESQIVKLKEQNDKLWDKFHDKQDEYWKQKQYISWVQWQGRVKNRKVAEKERQAKRALYQERQQQRQKQQKLKKYAAEIESINYLISYLKEISSSSQSTFEEKKEIKIDQTQVSAKLASQAQWKKEKGLELIKSKKDKEDQQPQKKYKKKNKKKQQAKQEEKKQFKIPFEIETIFAKLYVSMPTSQQQVEQKINELRMKEQILERVAKEQCTEEEKEYAQKIRSSVKEEKKAKINSEKASKKEQDFPTI